MAASDAYRGLLLSNLTAVKYGRINYQMSVPAQPGEITILSGTFAAVMAASFFGGLHEFGVFCAALYRTSYYSTRPAARTSRSAALASRRARPSVSASLIAQARARFEIAHQVEGAADGDRQGRSEQGEGGCLVAPPVTPKAFQHASGHFCRRDPADQSKSPSS